MFFWFNRDGRNARNTKLPKVQPKFINKQLSNNQKRLTFSENNKTVVYPRFSPVNLPAINSRYPYRMLERQRTYIVSNPVFVKPTKSSKQQKKPKTFSDFKKNLKKRNKNNKNENGMIWIDL